MFTKRLDQARQAYKKRSVEESRKAHTKEAIVADVCGHREEHKKDKGQYIGDVVYGSLDGIITTFAIVAGVAGARLDASIVIVLGFANLLADGLSMAVGNYLSVRAELEYIENERKREEWEIENCREGEVEEVKQIFSRFGFKGNNLDQAVKTVTADKKVWIEIMMHHELGLIKEDKTPFRSGLATFIAFVAVGFVPLLAFVLSLIWPGLAAISFNLSIIFTFVTLFAVGASKVMITGLKWWRSGLEMLVLGGVAAGVAYLIGYVLQGLI